MQAYRYASIQIYVRQTYKQAEKQSETIQELYTYMYAYKSCTMRCVGVIQEEKGSFAVLNWWPSCTLLLDSD